MCDRRGERIRQSDTIQRQNRPEKLPPDPGSDLRLLEEVGADYVFMPSVEEVYPEPDTRTFDFGMIDKVMEGATRPGTSTAWHRS